MRHVLIAVAGTTPQVVTETMWWLAVRGSPPVHVDVLHIVATDSTLTKVQTLCGEDGMLAHLARDLKQAVPTTEIHVFKTKDGRVLEDIRSSADSTAFAVGITELVRRLTMDPDTTVHASISGGRKTMGFHLGHAMSLFARPYDRLSHVLVRAEFEQCDDFWYPGSQPRLVFDRHGGRLDSADAEVELTDIQFVRLRGRLTARELLTAVSDTEPLVRGAQAAVDQAEVEAQITLEIDAIMSTAITLTGGPSNRPRPLAAILAVLRDQSWLVLRVVTNPDGFPAIRFFVDCCASANTAESARSAVQALASDMRHALDLERTGYRVLPSTAEPPKPSPEWTVQLVPIGSILMESVPRQKLPVDSSARARGLRAAGFGQAGLLDSLPLHSIATSHSPFELAWKIERVVLTESERQIIETIHDAMTRATRTMAGEVRYEATSVFPRAQADAITTELEYWKHRPVGFRVALVVRGTGAVPNALLAQIGGTVWAGRAFEMVIGKRSADGDPAILDISDCFNASRPPPFDLPTPTEFHLAGMPSVWQPAPRGLSMSGVRLGISSGRQIHLGDDARTRHVYVLGSTGTGKSTLLRNLILQGMEAGEGVFVLDPHGDLFEDIRCNVPISRTDDVIALDAGDVEYPFGLNFLEVDTNNRELSVGFIINELLAIFYRLYRADVPEAFGPMFEQYYRLVMLLLVDNEAWPEPSLLDIGRIFSDSRFRSMLIGGCKNPAVKDLMKMALDAQGDPAWENVAPYISSKFVQFTLNPLSRNICCQTRSTVDFRAAMDQGRIVLVRLPKGQLTEVDVRLLGMLIIGRLFGAALGRAENGNNARRPMHVYIDEFQNFVTETAGQMMAEARKYGLKLTLANQTLAQLDNRLRDVVLGNAANLLAFRTGPADAAVLEPFLAPSITRYDLQALPNFHCATRILSEGAPVMPPFVMQTEPPISGSMCAPVEALIEISRTRFAVSRGAVEAKLSARKDLRPDSQR